jgi:hypothetical protein
LHEARMQACERRCVRGVCVGVCVIGVGRGCTVVGGGGYGVMMMTVCFVFVSEVSRRAMHKSSRCGHHKRHIPLRYVVAVFGVMVWVCVREYGVCAGDVLASARSTLCPGRLPRCLVCVIPCTLCRRGRWGVWHRVRLCRSGWTCWVHHRLPVGMCRLCVS